MPSESAYPSLPIPDVDLWAFLFERKDKPYADDKGESLVLMHGISLCATLINSGV